MSDAGVSGSEWTGRTGKSWAHEWQRTDRSFGPLTQELVAEATAVPFQRALDIGCGAGEVSIRLAKMAPSAKVSGVDISDELLAVARERAVDLPNASFELADASRWNAAADDKPDLVISRHGVMFFDDPVAAFTHISRQAAAKSRLVFSCFRERSENEWARELASVLDVSTAPSDPRAPGPFAFGEQDYVAGILEKAGWGSPRFEPIDYGMIAGEGADALDDATSYFLRIGPAARAISEMSGDKREEAISRLRTMLGAHREAERIELPASCWIVSATSAR
ncbi:methyltransferase domain-containing protein [Qipengyuania sp. GH38]|uniref:class I SAM-dependent methyltransferase n=1 Tax=Qipengyuania intermedia TaxID=2867244 RepID=UPI001C8877C7|nr:class I SAM-dependent methyltransferase [Qipengyuania intermedia]MBX7515075.1 methyltransferase domain-containing protein [Qipengyuania intermedia]